MGAETTPLLAGKKPSNNPAYKQKAKLVSEVDNKFSASLTNSECHVLYLAFFNSLLNTFQCRTNMVRDLSSDIAVLRSKHQGLTSQIDRVWFYLVICDRLMKTNSNEAVRLFKANGEAITFVREQLLDAIGRPQVQRRGGQKACGMTAAVFAVCTVALVLYERLRAHWSFNKVLRPEHGAVIGVLGLVVLIPLALYCRRRHKVAAINAVSPKTRAARFLTNPALASVQQVEVKQALANMAAGHVPMAQP